MKKLFRCIESYPRMYCTAMLFDCQNKRYDKMKSFNFILAFNYTVALNWRQINTSDMVYKRFTKKPKHTFTRLQQRIESEKIKINCEIVIIEQIRTGTSDWIGALWNVKNRIIKSILLSIRKIENSIRTANHFRPYLNEQNITVIDINL